jgi:hypothetical protein
MRGIIGLGRLIAVALALAASSGAIAAESDVWSVSRSTGEVWIATAGEAKQVSLKQDETLKPGDTIRTGRNGRVLLIRGEETMIIAPNSVVGLPLEKKDGLSTTILQQAGSILLDVEKRNVKHFEVETPYLAAVVKGTQFSVTVSATGTRVDVRRGQVEVADFKSGQIAQVLPGQIATSFAHGKPGLSLTGAGVLNPIEHGRPRASSIERVPVPKGGLSAPHNAASGKFIHALGHIDTINGKLGTEPLQQKQAADRAPIKPKAIRIPGALGEVTLNVQKATRGLARGSAMPGVKNSSVRNSPTKDTVWSDAKANASGVSALGQDSSNGGNVSTAAGVGAGAAVTAPSNGNGNDNDKGATGNGKGNGNGNNGNGNSGNGNAYGQSKNK